MTKRFKRVGVVARFKPVHLGHQAMLEAVCEAAEHVIIGLGSSNRYNYRNPWTVKESMDMVEAVLKGKYDNYEFVHVPDLGNGPRWREQVVQAYGTLDAFITANDYVASLLKNDYSIIHPATLILKERHVFLEATMVRVAIAANEPWQHMVPKQVSEYLIKHDLVSRFKAEFGEETLLREEVHA